MHQLAAGCRKRLIGRRIYLSRNFLLDQRQCLIFKENLISTWYSLNCGSDRVWKGTGEIPGLSWKFIASEVEARCSANIKDWWSRNVERNSGVVIQCAVDARKIRINLIRAFSLRSPSTLVISSRFAIVKCHCIKRLSHILTDFIWDWIKRGFKILSTRWNKALSFDNTHPIFAMRTNDFDQSNDNLT